MNNNKIEMLVCVDGKPTKEYLHGKMPFIEAKEGSEFTIKLRNHSSRRAVATISVDGRCAISSKEASESDDGYIINAFSAIEIKGFRISDNEVATFKFSSGKDSYASYLEVEEGKIKDGESSKNNGVIGVKITWEKEKPQIIYKDRIIYRDKKRPYIDPWDYPITPYPYLSPTSPWYTTFTCSSSGSSASYVGDNSMMRCCNSVEAQPSNKNLNSCVSLSSTNFDLGTSFGEKKTDCITYVSFEKSDETFTMEIYYASRTALVEMGVDLNPKKQITATIPSAFGETKFCKIPSGWEK